MKPYVNRLVPMAHVVDVEQSIRFYELLGFEATKRLSQHGQTNWAWLESGFATLMLARASGPISAGVQAVLFYLYSPDVVALRAHLLANGVHEGGAYVGASGANGGRCVVFDLTQPMYMPKGEFRVHDPDAYCLLIGQLG